MLTWCMIPVPGGTKTSAMTEWSATSSAGITGFTAGGVIPPPHRLDLLGRDHLPVLVPQQVLQQHLEGERQVVHAQPVQPVQLPPATAEHHRITGLQAIHGASLSSRPHRGGGHPVTSVTYAAMDFSPRARAAATR
jgi:hypothetical protein